MYHLESLRQKPSRVKILLTVSILIIIFVVIILAIIAYLNLKPAHSSISITGYSDYSSIPAETRENLQRQLFSILSEHFDVSANTPININIRPETYHVENKQGINTASFIMDLDAYQQSYSIQMVYSDEHHITEDVFISCAPTDVTKFPQQTCYGAYENTDSPRFYLPYTGKTSSDVDFTATYSFQDDYGFDHIRVSVKCRDDSETKEQAVLAAKDYLQSIESINSNRFIYERASDYKDCK